MASPGQAKAPQHPLEKSYGVSLTVAIVSLVPFIIITTAFDLYEKLVGADIGIAMNALSVISAMSTAGYAFGALLGGDIIQRFPQRKLFFYAEAVFVAGCVLCASAFGMVQFGAGMVLLAFATGQLLVIALPPVIRRFPAEKMTITSGMVNLGFFGATTVGPLIGGAVAFGHAWRWLYAGFAAVGLMNLATSYFSLPSTPPMKPDARFDFPAVFLALVATVLPFLASGELTGHPFHSYWFMLPLAVGFACFVAMLLIEYHQKTPLSPVKPMWHTIPLVGTIAAMIGGGAFITLLMLAERYETTVLKHSVLTTGLFFWPQVLGVIVTAVILMALIHTRYLPVFILAGMLLLIAAAILLLYFVPNGSPSMLLAVAALLGLGAGATVSPGLWMAAFSLPSKMVGRTFALVELVRSEADFMMGPVIVGVAAAWSGGGSRFDASGIQYAIWIALLITAATTGFMIVLYLCGGFRLPVPDLEDWLKGDRPGFESPALFAALRKNPKKPGES